MVGRWRGLGLTEGVAPASDDEDASLCLSFAAARPCDRSGRELSEISFVSVGGGQCVTL